MLALLVTYSNPDIITSAILTSGIQTEEGVG